MTFAEAQAALEQCWNSFPDSAQLRSPSQRALFDVLKRDSATMEVTTTGQTRIDIPRSALDGALAYLTAGGHTKDNPCEIRNKYHAPGPLAQATAVNGTQTIHYVLPILQQMGLVGIHSGVPNTAWVR
ncbi:hypothetical protein GTP38_05310 [Duganella sp. FT94W]|uniref:Uncharacterized protein n=1 Tax=Duganella lactea TaxID=2692173 RepID=A0ABW9V2G8_9BURK|nr:hypothetical protein [Duganella lactea]MYM33755.1 hypothetical protein [Duganella lactea]